MVVLGIIAKRRIEDTTPPVDPPDNDLVAVGTSEYATTYLKNDGTLYTVVGNDSGYSLQTIPLTSINQVQGGQYHTVAKKSTGEVYTIFGNSTTPIAYPLDFSGNPFTASYIMALYKNNIAIKSGEVWYWSVQDNSDTVNQFGGSVGTAPRKLTQPVGKTITKIVAASNTPPFSSLTFIWGLASDGTLWEWNRSTTTPVQVTGGWTGTVRDVALLGAGVKVVESTTGQLWAWGYNGSYLGAQDAWQNPNPQNVTAAWTSAGVTFPSKQLSATYNTLHIIDSADKLFGAGSNVQGNVGNGKQWPSWRTYSPSPYLWGLANGQTVQAPTIIAGTKAKKLFTSTTIAPYVWMQDMGNNWWSWGRNKGRVLGNGISLRISDEAAVSEYLNVPAARKVTPLTQTWVLHPVVNTATNRAPIANAGVDQYLNAGTTTTTLYGIASHQQQPTSGGVTVTMTYSWSRTSGPNTPTIVSPTSATTNITGMVDGTYVFNLSVTNSNGASDNIPVTIQVG